MKFQEQNFVIEVNELKTSYLFINGIENPILDIGSKACIGDMQELKKGYWLIKLKAIKVFEKTSLLIISENGADIPMIELRYNKNSATGKYTMDLEEKPKQVEKMKTIEENTSEERSLEEKAEEAVARANKVVERSIQQLQTNNIGEKDNAKKKEEPKSITVTKKENEEFPPRYMTKPTFIAGKSNSTYSFLCSNLLQEGNELVFVFEFENKLSTDLNISETVIMIKKEIKGRKSNEIINGAMLSKKVLKGRKEELIYVKCPYFQINENESVEIQFNEKTEYGMGRDISLEINFKAFSKIKVLEK